MDSRVFGVDNVLLLDIECERLEVCGLDGWRQRVALSRGEDAYSLRELPRRFDDLVSGRGVRIHPVTWLLLGQSVRGHARLGQRRRLPRLTDYLCPGSEGNCGGKGE